MTVIAPELGPISDLWDSVKISQYDLVRRASPARRTTFSGQRDTSVKISLLKDHPMETHSIALKIDSSAAQAGSKQFTAAINAIKLAVRDLDKDATGAFTKLRSIKPDLDTTSIKRASTDATALTTALTGASTASDKMASTTQRASLAAAMALRQASTSAQKLAFRLGDLGDTKALDQLDAGLDRLHASLQRAPDVAGVRIARSAYEDLRTELTQTATAAEYAKGSLAQTERQTREAATAADQYASAMERLRREFVPLYSASKEYEGVLDRISQAEQQAILTTDQAAAARDRAATGLLTAGRNADAFAGQMRSSAFASQQVGFQLNDIGVMLAGGMSPLAIATGQGTQLAQTFQTLGSRAEILTTLKAGFLSMVSPISLVTIGAIALGAGLYYGLSKAIPQAKSLEDALKDLDSTLSAAKSTAREAADLSGLAEKYGFATTAVQALVAAKRDLARLDAGAALKDAQDSFQSEFGFSKWVDTLRGYANNEGGQVRKLRDDLDLTTVSADRLNELLRQAQTAPNAQIAADAYAKMRDLMVQSAGGLDKLNAAQSAFVRGLADMEGKAREFVAIDLAQTITTAKGQTDSWITSMSGVAAQAQSVFNTLQALAGIKINISAPVINTPSLPKATNVSAPTANGEADSILGKITNIQDVSFQPEKPDAAIATTTQAVTTATTQRTAAMQIEGATTESVTTTLADRLTALEAERIALGLAASAQFATADAAQLMADAMVKGGGMVDSQTEAMIRQIDVASRLNEELRRVATDPVREWMKSVPNWIEAGQQIEMGAINSLKGAISDFIKTGKFDIEALGESVLGVIADIVADKAVAELANLLGRGNPDSKGLGGLLGGLLGSQGDAVTGPTMGGGADVAQGGVQAGTSISQAMVQAGQQVSSQIASAMGQGGVQAGQTVQGGMIAGGQSAGSSVRAAGVSHGVQVRTATSTSGAQHASTVRSAIVSGGQQHASMVGAASAGGGGAGGGILSSLGGLGGVLGMVLGAFSEGGMSNSPVGFASAPVSAFRNAPHFAQGTANTSGIPAVLHDNEAVIPLSKGRKIGVELNGDGAGGTVIHQPQTFNISTPDADSFRRSKTQIAADMARAGQSALGKNG